MQAVLTLGIGLIVAPLVVFFRDLERAVKLALRFLFYASPIIYGLQDLRTPRPRHARRVQPAEPASSRSTGRRSSRSSSTGSRSRSAPGCRWSCFGIGVLIFRRTIRTVLKEI